MFKIEPLFSQHHDTLSDNAAACFARMVLKFPDKVPLDGILPTFVEEALPLKEDFDENESVWDMIVKLCMFQCSICRLQSISRAFWFDFTPSLHITVCPNDLSSIPFTLASGYPF